MNSMPVSFLTSWPPVFALGILALLARAMSQSWLEAGPVCALVWFFSLALPLLFAPDYAVASSGLWWIALCAATVCAGSVMASYPFHPMTTPSRHANEKRDASCFPYLRCLILIAMLCGILSSVTDLSASWRPMTSLRGDVYVEMAHEMYVERHTQDVYPRWISRILLIGVYLSPMLGGMLSSVKQSRWDGCLSIASLLPALLMFALHTTRAAFILAGILWGAGWFAVRVWMWPEERPPWTARTAVVFLGIGLLGIALFGAGQVIREGKTPSWDTLWGQIASPGVRSAFFGHVSVFSGWFETTWDVVLRPAWGRYSLAGFFDLLGLSTREVGLYRDIQEVEPGGLSNIYTVFRGLIQDFTAPGALVVLFFMGGVAGRAYHWTRQGRLIWMPILIAFYALAGNVITSIFNYNSILFAWFLLSLYLWGIGLRGSGPALREGAPT